MLLSSIIPWKAKRLDVATPSGMWAFNPSIVRYRGRTLCSVRLANYHMPGARPSIDNPPRPSSRCVMVEIDDQLNVLDQCTIEEHDLGSREDDRSEHKRISKGFEDYRLFVVGDQLHGSASSACTCPSNMAVIELSHLRFHEDPITGRWELASAAPMRGEWSRAHQKNWMPYLGHPSGEPRWLYSIDRGGVHSPRGRVVEPSAKVRSMGEASQAPTPRTIAKFSPAGNRRSLASSNGEVLVFGRKRVGRASPQQGHGRIDHPLRGGTQLVKVPGSEATWIGLAHGYRADGDRKFYWHAWIAVDATGELRGTSRPFKLCNEGIEFAAGLVIDETSRQVAVSYGVDDDSAWIGVAPLGDILGMLPLGSIV